MNEMSTYMHHEEYDPELGEPTRQNLIELIDKYSSRPFIPVFHVDRHGTFTQLSIAVNVGSSKVYATDATDPITRYRYYVGCRQCYEHLELRLTNKASGHLVHDHQFGSSENG